jgi:hypothetical protein
MSIPTREIKSNIEGLTLIMLVLNLHFRSSQSENSVICEPVLNNTVEVTSNFNEVP